MKPILALLSTLALVIHPSLAAEKQRVIKTEAFVAFFADKKEVSYTELVKAMGKPSSRTPLRVLEEEDDIREDHAWLHYKVNEEVTISLTCPEGMISAAYIFTNGVIEAIWVVSLEPEARGRCSFSYLEIPDNERRLLELSSVFEYRCESIIPKSQAPEDINHTSLVIERYQKGVCVTRELISKGRLLQQDLKNDAYKGSISFGWQLDKQKLVVVNATGSNRWPGAVECADFQMSAKYQYFGSSNAEIRKLGDREYKLHPVIGMLGKKSESKRRLLRQTISHQAKVDFFKNREDAIIAYLYIGHWPSEEAMRVEKKKQDE